MYFFPGSGRRYFSIIFAAMQLNEDTLQKAQQLIEGARTILITNHVNPDGDAVGSALGLAQVLRSMGKEVKCVFPNYFSPNLRWMSGVKEVLYYDSQRSLADTALQEAELMIHLDYNALGRSGDMEQALRQISTPKINIDHHQQPENFAEANLCIPGASSTCEVVVHFLEQTGLYQHLQKSGAECLYSGIITDTGNFRFNSTTAQTHEVVAHLIALGVKPDWVANRIYDNNRPERLKLLGCALENMEILPDVNAAIICLRAEELERYNFKKGDTEGFVNYGLSIEGITLAAFFYPRDGGVKMSFRSIGAVDVNKLARLHFNGGGHVNAAGAYLPITLAEAIQKLKDVLPQYLQENQFEKANI